MPRRAAAGQEKKEDSSFEFSATYSAERVAEYLEALARHLRGRDVRLKAGNESIHLRLGPQVHLDIEAEQDGEKGGGSLELELTWRENGPAVEPASMEIEAGEEEELSPAFARERSQPT